MNVFWNCFIAYIIFVNTPAATCLNRIKSRGRKGECTLDEAYLTQLNDAFLKVCNESGTPMKFIDGTYDLQKDLENIKNQLQEFVTQHSTSS